MRGRFAEEIHVEMRSENRKEERHSLATEAVIERSSGEQVVGFTVNVSGSGMLVAVPSPTLTLGEEVHCGIRLYEGKPLQTWGIGKVVRVENAHVAIDFGAQEFE